MHVYGVVQLRPACAVYVDDRDDARRRKTRRNRKGREERRGKKGFNGGGHVIATVVVT